MKRLNFAWRTVISANRATTEAKFDMTFIFAQRREEVLRLAAEKALELPRLESGFWFHQDLRDNFYFAIHLLTYALDGAPAWEAERRSEGERLGVAMLSAVLSLQETRADQPMYGHWPLQLGSDPRAAKPHPLPVELMGCLIVYFYELNKHRLPAELRSELNLAMVHIYQSPVYRQPLASMHHHEAKHTALKLLLGFVFDDEALLADGTACAQRLLAHIRVYGFKEYGCLPWHWHWIQAFTCAYEVVTDDAARLVTGELLGLLWELRADVYLRGAWVGPHSRIWPHDAPKDTNTPHDYIQFGDFPAPAAFPRLEGAALYRYEVAEAIRARATNRTAPVELRRLVRFADARSQVEAEAHTCVYVAPGYAVGGVWERRDEFDNEQLRWDVSLPLDNEAARQGVNQLYFFHPGKKYTAGDDRHASPYGEVLLHQDAAVQLWRIPAQEGPETADALIGCLPRGEWRFGPRWCVGKLGAVFAFVYLLGDGAVEERPDRISVAAPLDGGWQGVVVEMLTAEEAADRGDGSLEALATQAAQRAPQWLVAEDGLSGSVRYTTKRGDLLSLAVRADEPGAADRGEARINGAPVDFSDYRV